MESLPNIFLQQISQEIFPGNCPPEVQSHLLKERFHQDNYRLKHTEIGKNLSQTLKGDCESGINQFLKEVIKKLYRTYEDELTQDDITIEMLGLCDNNRHGRKKDKQQSPWQVLYKWLWQSKYPRWQQDYLWDEWKNKAKVNSSWIQFSNYSSDYTCKGHVVPKPAAKPSIPVNTPLNLEIALDTPGSYLYLFNRGEDTQGNTTKYVISPSQAFAPNCRLMEKITLMPQQGAMCEDVGIQFDALGKEEYLGIVVDEPLDLPELTPDPINPALEWQGEHLERVWEKLRNKNWQVFYRDFEVVSSEEAA